MPEPSEILALALKRALESGSQPLVTEEDIADRLTYVVEVSPHTGVRNASGLRVLLACAVAKLHVPSRDIRKPYTEIGDDDVYSGRNYDEGAVATFIDELNLPANSTTAWLTPAWRNNKIILTRDVDLVGRPRRLYRDTIALLNDVHEGRISAETLLAETIRRLIQLRDAGDDQMVVLLAELKGTQTGGAIPLSGEDVVTIIRQHLESRNASRLPVLAVAAAYKAAREHLQEQILPLASHNAADRQTGALGDVEITLIDDEAIVTSYEMKDRRVTNLDINHALQKIRDSGKRVHNYIFITTEETEQVVHDHARALYEETGGIEFVILDCVSFVRHFIHLFHRLRINYLDAYQELVLAEPDSAVSQALKRVLLDLRINAQASLNRENT